MLDLQRLRYFVAVAEVENVGRAARSLHMTQSPLSRQIQFLEAELGFDLFERSGKRLRLTAAGRAFRVEAEALLAHSARIERQLDAMASGTAGPLAIGYVAGAMHAGLLAKRLGMFREIAPGADIELICLRSEEQRQKLLAREIDIGFAYSSPNQGQPLHFRKVHEEPFRLAVPAGRGWKTSPSAKTLQGEAFVALPQSSSAEARLALVNACRRAGFSPDIRYEAADPLAVLQMVDAGLGSAIVQASLERLTLPGVSFFDLPPTFDMAMPIYLVRAEKCSPVAQAFFEMDDADL